jgi:hypothetical protein
MIWPQNGKEQAKHPHTKVISVVGKIVMPGFQVGNMQQILKNCRPDALYVSVAAMRVNPSCFHERPDGYTCEAVQLAKFVPCFLEREQIREEDDDPEAAPILALQARLILIGEDVIVSRAKRPRRNGY